MAVPRGYRRNSSGFIQPIGSVPSGRVSGPPAGYAGPIGTGPDALPGLTRSQFPETAREKKLRKDILASYEKADIAHKNVMANIAKADADTFKRLSDATNASKESDPKDKLGNTIPSAQTKYLERMLINHMASSGMKNAQASSPEKAGIKPEQLEAIGAIGPGGPGGGSKEVDPATYSQPFGPREERFGAGDKGFANRRDLLHRPQGMPQGSGTHPTFGPVDLIREQAHPQTGEMMDIIRLQDGTLKAVRKGEFKLTEQRPKGILNDLFSFLGGGASAGPSGGGGGR
jgi:hypothetical protein